MSNGKIDLTTYTRLAKNSFWALISNISMVFILLLTIFASRVLGDVAFGQYVFLLAITTVLADLSVLGTTDYAGILVSRESHETHKIVANSLGLRIPFIVLFLIASEAIAWFSMPGTLWVGFLLALDWGVRTIIHLFRAVLRARNVFAVDASVATIERLAVLFFAGGGLYFYGSLLPFAFGFLIGRLLGLAACIRAYVSLGERLYLAFDYTVCRRLLKGGVPIGIRGLFKIIAFRIDAVMLGFFRPAAEVGWYGAAYKLLEASLVFHDALGTAFQPTMSQYYGRGEPRTVADIGGRALKISLIVGGLSAALGFSFSDAIVLMVFGTEYTQAAEALEILVWAMLAVFCSLSCIVLMDAVEFGRKTIPPFVMAAVGNILLNAVFIPRFGLLGASWSTLITEVFLASVLLRLLFTEGYSFPVQWIFGPLLACAVLTVTCLLFKWLNWPLAGVLIGIVLFFYMLMILRVFDKVDLKSLQNRFSLTGTA